MGEAAMLESGEDAALIEPAHLARGALHDDVAKRDLTVAAEGDLIGATHRQDGGAVILFHGDSRKDLKAAGRA